MSCADGTYEITGEEHEGAAVYYMKDCQRYLYIDSDGFWRAGDTFIGELSRRVKSVDPAHCPADNQKWEYGWDNNPVNIRNPA